MENSTRSRTPLFFQQALVEEIRKITSGMLFHAPQKRELVPLEVFSQSIPIPVYGENESNETNNNMSSLDYESSQLDDPVFKCPWCIVKLVEGNVAGINEQQSIQVAICFGVFNDDPHNQGHFELLNLFQKVYERFAVNPILDGQFTCTGVFDWALQDEETYPYYFGAITTGFNFMGYRREIKY